MGGIPSMGLIIQDHEAFTAIGKRSTDRDNGLKPHLRGIAILGYGYVVKQIDAREVGGLQKSGLIVDPVKGRLETRPRCRQMPEVFRQGRGNILSDAARVDMELILAAALHGIDDDGNSVTGHKTALDLRHILPCRPRNLPEIWKTSLEQGRTLNPRDLLSRSGQNVVGSDLQCRPT